MPNPMGPGVTLMIALVTPTPGPCLEKGTPPVLGIGDEMIIKVTRRPSASPARLSGAPSRRSSGPGATPARQHHWRCGGTLA